MNAVEQENLAKNIVEVLYPADEHYAGKELRLKQQYFFISASVQAAITKYKKKHSDIRKFYEKATFQLNDTHPTVAVAELMRILMDEEGLDWDEAWEVTTKTCAYTNHTIMAEALEKWPIELFCQTASAYLSDHRGDQPSVSLRRSQAASIRATRTRSAKWQSSTTDR